MKVTIPNIARFWKRLMFPPDTNQYRYNRLVLRADMPWEPWLHAGVWCSILLILFIGERGVVPPIDGIDWVWVVFGLISPTVGFFSVWTLEHHKGRPRYYALWGRMLADAGLVITLLTYQIDIFFVHEQVERFGFGYKVLPNMILFLAMWFTATLVIRDIRFIMLTERVAAEIYRNVHYITVAEWAAEWGEDAG